jgi:multidrug efflux pump subunit AcrA (membrane-fusion protein)
MRSIYLRSAFTEISWRPVSVLLAAGTAALLLGVIAGCNRQAPAAPSGVASGDGAKAGPQMPSVATVKPTRNTVRYLIKQPGYNIEAFEQTPVYAKVPGYVRKVNVDMGDRLRTGEVLAELYVPEMEVDVRQKAALVTQADAEVKQAQESAVAAEAGFRSSEAKVKEAEASRLRADAELVRAQSQYERLKQRAGGVISQDQIDELRLGYEAAKANVAEVEAKVKSALATQEESRAKLGKAQADVEVARAHLEVARQNHEYAKAMLGYTKLLAPYDGVVTRRSVDTGDFVQPATSGSSKGEPLFNVERTDILRIFVNVPEMEAYLVRDHAPARVRVPGLQGKEFQGQVTRTAKALDPRSRTLRTEIDLPNPGQLQSGMYVHVTITVEHPNVWTLPASAVVTQGEHTFCYHVENGKAIRTRLKTGIRDGEWVEVLQKQTQSAKPGQEGQWEDFTGSEQVVQKDPGTLRDGQTINVALVEK